MCVASVYNLQKLNLKTKNTDTQTHSSGNIHTKNQKIMICNITLRKSFKSLNLLIKRWLRNGMHEWDESEKKTVCENES